jgi:hypothetical protein
MVASRWSLVAGHYTKRLDNRRAGVGPDASLISIEIEELETLILP